MAYLTDESLRKLGFKRLGKNVKISDKVSIYNPELMEFDDHSRVDDFCLLSGKVKLGRNVHIAAFCNIAGGEMGVDFQDFCGLAYGSHVLTQSDDYTGKALVSPTIPAKYKCELKSAVLFKKHALVGTCCVIMPGVTLEEGTVIGAMSLVTKSTEPWSIYVGIPAKKVKERKRDMLQLEQQYLREEASIK